MAKNNNGNKVDTIEYQGQTLNVGEGLSEDINMIDNQAEFSTDIADDQWWTDNENFLNPTRHS